MKDSHTEILMGILHKLQLNTFTQCRILPLICPSQVSLENIAFNRNLINYSIKKYNSNSEAENQEIQSPLKSQNKINENEVSRKTYKTVHSWLNPHVPKDALMNNRSVTGVIVNSSTVSWVKVSLVNFEVLEWKAKKLPIDFASGRSESNLLRLAHDLRQDLPSSDMYVMEGIGPRNRDLLKNLNEIHLYFMLAILLSDFAGDKQGEKVYFQNRGLMNSLHDLLVGYERISTRPILQNILNEAIKKNFPSEDNISHIYSLLKVTPEHLDFFLESDFDKQEGLSLALLLTLSFIDVFIFENENTLLTIQAKIKKYQLKRQEKKISNMSSSNPTS